ncbi:TPA: DUF692 domain-containing protein [Legionella pneumophila]|uniref:MNIO family bufferin maturase n=1 Tax=Legionella pneumophila TaxID=446 RepID=UPI0005AB5AAF|nr:DUF692 domain-containing protein [Legionella pneumophila]HAT1809865.1 DUF692 domain-containing protein [Legionella pneumophila]HAT1871836.1 DUF692 domain-containing protein [Legionella pneumophila]HBD9402435.1 DUF692 domain-containing protein [Legionella pneumophila]HDS3848376.1 DUF692 domain-containing protein [Legionella pneumophila]HDV5737722.1 DUF692 domain-containing protein [Legionella pneumophila]
MYSNHSIDQAAPYSGCSGIGLRLEHIDDILKEQPTVDYFEVLADNYMKQSGVQFKQLLKIAEFYPVSLHSVGLSIATSSEPDYQYLQQIKDLAHCLNSKLISDHLCWTHANQFFTHELIPFPYTEETLSFIIEKTNRVQEYLNQPIMYENVSRYVTYRQNTLSEAEFLNELSAATGCGILLDINNLYVNWYNHGDDPDKYLHSMNTKNVWQMHLGGFSKQEGYLLDSHSDKVYQDVWQLYEKAQNLFINTPTVIEWDNDLPDFSLLYDEMCKAKTIIKRVAERSMNHYA